MLTQNTLFKVLHENRSPLKLYSHDDGHLWELSREIVNSKDHKLRKIAEDLINDKM